ncbi:TIR domain-containing protein [Nocardia sp. CA-107356]|uniref:toll/interleukin-1 receptor domain-containing protein n=1 Tax=Nocardia sp. CA-107356 TaxID=3239972 RepID=UPI003D94B24A
MARVFISHASADTQIAVAVKRWLIGQQPDLAGEIFLDVDDLQPGQEWKDALRDASDRCEAVIVLVSQRWLASHECLAEYRVAEYLGKQVFSVRVEPITGVDVTCQWQRCDLYGDGPSTGVSVDGAGDPVSMSTAGLERLLAGLRASGIGADVVVWPPENDPDRSPYRGWEPFDPDDAAVYFGRDGQIVRAMDRLRAMRMGGVRSLFVIVGPSGTGKSSFLRAGLIPRLRCDDRDFVLLDLVRPERDAVGGVHGLAATIHAARTRFALTGPSLGTIAAALIDRDVLRLRGWLTGIQQAAHTRLLDAGAVAPTLVLPVDQAEELLAADAGGLNQVFLELVGALLSDAAGVRPSVIVALTIRTDRFDALQSHRMLAEVGSEVFDELKPLSPDRFRDIITAPAVRAPHRLELTADLVDRLLTDCADGADTLPLLALTLAELYRAHASTGVLTLDHYMAVGGIERIVATQIDQVLDPDPATRRQQLDVLRSAFIPWLATVTAGSEVPQRRVALWDDLPVAARGLLDRFVDARLLLKDRRTTSEGEDETVVEVAMESLLWHWDTLADWLHTEAADLRTADDIERAAADWHRNDRGTAWLWTGSRLADAEILATQPGYRERLAPAADFLIASRRQVNDQITSLRRRARILLVLTVVTVLTATAAVIGLIAQTQASHRAQAATHRAETLAKQAVATQLTDQADSMFTGTTADGPYRAIQQVLAAHALSPGTTDSAVLNARYRTSTIARTWRSEVTLNSSDLGASSDGTTVAVRTDDRLVITRSGSPDQQVRLPGQIVPGQIGNLAVSGNGSVIAAGDNTRNLFINRVGAADQWIELPHRVNDVAVNRDGSTIAVGDDDGNLLIIHNGSVDQRLKLPDGVGAVAVSGDGGTVAASDASGNLLVIRSGRSEPLRRMSGTSGNAVAISDDGDTIAAATGDGSDLMIVRAGAPDEHVPSNGYRSVAVSGDGSTVVAGGGDDNGGVLVIDRSDAREPQQLHLPGAVGGVAVSRDGTTIAAAGPSDLLIIRPGIPDQHAKLQGESRSVVVSRDGSTIAVGDLNRNLLINRAGASDQRLQLPGAIELVVVSDDGNAVTTSSSDGTWLLLHPGTQKPHLQMPHQISDITVSRDGRTVAALDDDGNLLITGPAFPDRRLQFLTPQKQFASLAVSGDGNTVAVLGDNDVLVIRPDRPVEHIGLPPNDIGSTLSADGSTVIGWAADANAVDIIRSGTSARRLELPQQIAGVDVSDGERTIVANDTAGNLLITHPGVPDQRRHLAKPAAGVAVSSDGSTVAVGDADGGLSIIRPGILDQKIQLLIPIQALSISRDGSTIAAYDASDLLIIRPGTPNQQLPFPQGIRGAVVSDDGKTVAVVDNGGSVWLAEQSGTESVSAVVATPGPSISSLAVTNSNVVFVTSDGVVHQVPILTPDADALCAKLKTSLSINQWQQWISHDLPYQRTCPALPPAQDG